MTALPLWKDKFQREIHPGDFVAFAVSRYSSGYLEIGIALKYLDTGRLNVMCFDSVFPVPRLNHRVSSLYFSDKLMVLAEDQLSPEHKQVLTDYYKQYLLKK